jgi:hypothetical protein
MGHVTGIASAQVGELAQLRLISKCHPPEAVSLRDGVSVARDL